MSMPKKFTSTSARIVASLFVFAIIIGFVFTFTQDGSSNFFRTQSDVAKVDGTPITYREFQMEMAQNAQRYKQFFGGNDLSAEQIEQFGIPATSLQALIERKALYNLSNSIGLLASAEEIKEEIKDAPYFKTNGKFDVERYKAILIQNSLTPASFEESIKENLQTRKIQELVLERPVSRFYVEDIAHFKSHVVKVNAARIEKSALQPFIEVSSKELTDYLKDEKNSGILKMMYDGRKAEFEKPEEVKAYHILFKGSDEKTKARIELLAKTLNTKNFKTIASKQTEDPSGKNKDGALGWFAPGKMVPEFDKVAFSLKPGSISKPFKTSFGYHIVYVEDKKTAQKTSFDKAKVQLAEEAIRRKKSAALDELMKKVSTEIKTAFEKSNINMAKQIADKYKLNFFKDDEINAFDAKLGNHSINDQRLKTLFSSKNKVIEFTDSSFAWVFDVKNTVQKAKDDKLAKSELNGQANQISRLFRNEFIKNITQTASIDCMADFQKVSYCNN